MKIQYMSDLHLEFQDMPVPFQLADTLVLAGDIAVGPEAITDYLNKCAKVFKSVIFVYGNHEFYGYNMKSVKQHVYLNTANNVHVLDQGIFFTVDVAFIGATLWSQADHMAQSLLNDFYAIKNGPTKRFDITAYRNAHFSDVEYIVNQTKALKNAGFTVVAVTHHAPTFEVKSAEYPMDAMSTCFYSDVVGKMLTKPDYWIYGHTHSNIDITIGDCYVTTNQRGYGPNAFVDNFNEAKILDV